MKPPSPVSAAAARFADRSHAIGRYSQPVLVSVTMVVPWRPFAASSYRSRVALFGPPPIPALPLSVE